MRRVMVALSLTAVVVAAAVVAPSAASWALASKATPRSNDAKDSDIARTASLDLIRSIVPPEAYDAILEQMYQQMSASIQQPGGAGVPAGKQKDLRDAVKECLPYDDLLSWTASVYTKHFTTQEIDDVAAFYATSTGKKAARLMPALTGEVGAKIGPLLMTRLPEALRKHGIQ